MMGRSTSGSDACPAGFGCTVLDDTPEHGVTLATFALDKYEITVGRFRKFVTAYTGAAPAAGAGANPNIAGTGWDSAWNANLAPDATSLKAALACSAARPTWTDSPGANEDKALTCLDWYTAFAFCIWDGGRLPTEAEWEYAAAGGCENRLFPWGSTLATCTLANYTNFAGCGAAVNPPGSDPTGNGLFQHADLAGNVAEWVFDYYDQIYYSSSPATNPANVTASQFRVVRGGSWNTPMTWLRVTARTDADPAAHDFATGARCARNP
jgi:formylglycine-generating enzyme required for sulfatase activity